MNHSLLVNKIRYEIKVNINTHWLIIMVGTLYTSFVSYNYLVKL